MDNKESYDIARTNFLDLQNLVEFYQSDINFNLAVILAIFVGIFGNLSLVILYQLYFINLSKTFQLFVSLLILVILIIIFIVSFVKYQENKRKKEVLANKLQTSLMHCEKFFDEIYNSKSRNEIKLKGGR